MKENPGKRNKAGFGLLEIVLALLAVLLLAYMLLNTSYKKKPVFDKATERALLEEHINTADYQSAIDSAKEKVKDIEQRQNQTLNPGVSE